MGARKDVDVGKLLKENEMLWGAIASIRSLPFYMIRDDPRYLLDSREVLKIMERLYKWE